ncbi:uncharacterized protein V1513DRAFT_441765 [Lipomyces chichibuensis]|uniref:uncharacterized protein n=1 Tax=Lipomyces chichibuensis TaxID=1546026 RepID=UPI003342EE53
MAATSHEGLLNVGEHCAFSGCHKLDFLPFRCPACESKYCLDHRQPSSHNCAGLKKTPKPPGQSTTPKSASSASGQRLRMSEVPQICYTKDCSTTINTPLSPATKCPTCKNLTCLKHRLNHSCPGAPTLPVMTTQKTALAKFAEWKQKQQAKGNGPMSGGSSAKSSTSDNATSSVIPSFFKSKPKAESSIVIRAREIAALKQNAKGDAHIQPANRVYVFVESNIPDSSKQPRVEMYFGRDYSIGRILDRSAQRLQISNQNNSKNDDKDRLRLYHVEGGRVLEFSEKLESCKVKDGDTLAVVKGLVMPTLLH